ncbi:VHS-domain-containing protein [Cristinia sonorae]|uniref:VHS-domain-containing protein n=1 Tax=Cristinia sonorae TaxID=1940300 RepID=A0A8K0XNA9_9AGAR|nr:VHS-domain-containing protein [Cristinia sonorae]
MFNAASASGWMQDTSPLKILITRATYPSLPEPNYAINLEVAEYINQKKANSSREAAMFIANLVNHRNPHVAILALSLLDTLVQSCGYPFHLQIATKEFLNELVRRFPERPPPFPGPVMSRILELIHRWKEGICTESRWKEDLGNIRDMHRLLTFKGYRFRDIPRQPNLSAATSNLKTAEELENEDREAQSAKLQELIRRGTPRDLAQAQELMKSLAGANPDAKPDYKTQAFNEIHKLESQIILLTEMLDNSVPGERSVQGDAYDQVATILGNARPKIQGWISDAESFDPDELDTFLKLNDQINSVLGRYDAWKRGDYAAAKNPIPNELSNSNAAVSLIDFDDSAPTTSSGAQAMNDLESLFGSSSPPVPQQPQQQLHSQPQGISVFGQQPVYSAFPPGFPTNATIGGSPSLANTSAPSPYNHGTSTPTSTPGGMIRLGTPQLQPQGSGSRVTSPAPNYFSSTTQNTLPTGAGLGFSNTNGSNGFGGLGGGQIMTPQQQQSRPSQQQQQPQTNNPQSGQAQGKDPFADLVGLF